jgi:hypothetical protein
VNDWDYVEIARELMLEYKVGIRDTYCTSHNYDDLYINSAENGPRRFRITFTNSVSSPRSNPNCTYEIAGFKSIAYDDFKIEVPLAYRNSGRTDPVIHECVHFLQEQTRAEESSYVPFVSAPGETIESRIPEFTRYLCQRVEREAHFVQLIYIFRTNQAQLSILDGQQVSSYRNTIAELKASPDMKRTETFVIDCKRRELI